MSLRLTILGCGSSGGVPRVAGGWGHCDPANPRNRRRRCSILLERTGTEGVTRVLVDTSPDLREQLIDAGVQHLDAVVFTHEHADHTHGIDDLRPLAIHMRRRVDVYADHVTLELLMQRFGYCFLTPPGSDYPPILNAHRLDEDEPLTIKGKGGAIVLDSIRLPHGNTEALALRCEDIAYAPDVSDIPAEAAPFFAGLDLLILDALRPTPHPSHLSLPEALAWIERLRPRQAVLTNLHTDLDYATLSASLPAHIRAAYDGMVLP